MALRAALGVLLLTGLGHAWAAGAELVFGVYPYLSPTQIVDHYSPLKDYLAQVLGRPVSMVSAPDFPAFIARTRQGDYDIVFTAPHMGRLAERRDGWRRVVQTGYQMEIVALTRNDSELRRLEDLRGRSIAIGSRDSMSYQVVNEALGHRGLALESQVRVIETPSFSNVMHALVRGEADAGATSKRLWGMAPESQRSSVREIFQSQPTPGFLIMAHPRLGEAAIGAVQKALLQFKDTAAGEAFFRKTQQLDFRPIDDATMRRIDPYTAVLTEPR